MGLLKSPTSTPIAIRSLPFTCLRLPKIPQSTSVPLLLSPIIVRVHPASQFSQRRALWGWGRGDHEPSWHSQDEDPLLRRLKRVQKQNFLKRAYILRRQAWLHHRLPQRLHPQHHHHNHHQHPWSNWGRGWRGFRHNRSDGPEKLSNDSHYKLEKNSKRKELWKGEDQIDEFEQFRKEVEKDPYNFLFGKSNEWLSYRDGRREPWSSFVRSFFGSNEPEAGTPERNQQVSSIQTQTESKEVNEAEREVRQWTSKDQPVKDEDIPASMESSGITQSTRFDPVSGRMVPVHSHKAKAASETTEIPVKKYTSQDERDASGGPSKAEATKSQALSSNSPMSSKQKSTDVLHMSAPPEDMETLGPSSMDGNSISSDIPSTQQYDVFSTPEPEISDSPLRIGGYSLEETKQDDVDLLRASDVRAALFSKKTKQDLETEKMAQRESLDRQFDTYKDPERGLLIQEVRRTGDQTRSSGPSASFNIMSSARFPREPRSKKIEITGNPPNEVREIYKDSYGKIAPEHQQQSQSTSRTPPTTQDTQTARMSNKPALSDFGSALDSVKKFSDSVSEAAEEIIKACTRLEKAKSQQSNSTSAIYRVLAYDSSSLQIVIAETDSTFNSPEATLHPTDVLSRLNNPAKFLPYFGQMQADGYEIVSGGGDILVFKKARRQGSTTPPLTSNFDTQSTPNLSSNSQTPRQTPVEDAISSTTTASESPQGATSTQANPATDPQGSRMVRRQETVYTGGPPNWSPYPPPPSHGPPASGQSETNTNSSQKNSASSSPKQRFRENAFFLVIGAASIYAVDVVYDYFRTGGEDGRGPEGFTAFEMERRRRQ